MKSNFYKSNIFSIIFYSLLFQLFSKRNENPKEISENYIQINLLSSGQSFTFNNNNIFVICTYDLEFSEKIKLINNNNQKYILCLRNSLSNSYLYITNSTNNYLYKFDFIFYSNISIASSLNLFPFLDKNNCLSFLITFFESKNELVYFDKYIINININKSEIKKEKRFLLNEVILNSAYRYPNSEISSKFLACYALNKKSIYSYIYEDKNNTIIINNITCQNCLDKMNLSETKISYSYYINIEQYLIFICFKFNSTKVNCYFYNILYNSFIYNNNVLECQNNMNNYYIKETKEYALVCQNSNKINVYLLDSQNLNQNYTYYTIYIDENLQNLSHNLFLYYNCSYNEYNLIDNIYDNYTNEYSKTNFSFNNNDINNMFINYRKLESSNDMNDIISNISNYIKENYQPSSPFLTYKTINNNNINYNIIIKDSNTSFSGITELQFDECEFLLKNKNNYTDFLFFY